MGLAQQLVGAGEKVVDVPPKLAARARLLDNGETNKNDPNDARSVAVAALRAKRLSEITKEDHAAVMRLWARRRKDLTSSRTRVANRLHAVILELVPGGYAGEIYANKVARLRSHFAAYNGSAPIEVSSGPKKLYRLSMRGSRQLNHALHMAAVTQVRHAHSEGRAYYDRKVTEGKTHKEALRALKRRISDALYAAMVADARRERQEERASGGPGGQTGSGSVACAAGSHPAEPALRPSHSRAKTKATPLRPAARTGLQENQKKISKAS